MDFKNLVAANYQLHSFVDLLGWCLKLQAIWLGLPWHIGWFGIGEIRSAFTSSWFPWTELLSLLMITWLSSINSTTRHPRKLDQQRRFGSLLMQVKQKQLRQGHVWWTKWSRYCSCCLKFPRGDNGSPIWKNTKAIFDNHARIACY